MLQMLCLCLSVAICCKPLSILYVLLAQKRLRPTAHVRSGFGDSHVQSDIPVAVQQYKRGNLSDSSRPSSISTAASLFLRRTGRANGRRDGAKPERCSETVRGGTGPKGAFGESAQVLQSM